MKKTEKSKNSLIINTSELSASDKIEAIRLQNEHEERTTWRKDLILTIAQAISLVILSISCAIALYYVVKQQNNELLKQLTHVLVYILSFCAGRSTNHRKEE